MNPSAEKVNSFEFQRDLQVIADIEPVPHRRENENPWPEKGEIGSREVHIEGMPARIHVINNFDSFVRAYIGSQKDEILFVSKYDQEIINHDPVCRIMDLFQVQFPELYADLINYDHKRMQREELMIRYGLTSPKYKSMVRRLAQSEEDLVKEQVIYSMSYDTICEIIRRLNIDFDNGLLTKHNYSYIYEDDMGINIAFHEENELSAGTEVIEIDGKLYMIHNAPNFHHLFNAYMDHDIPDSPDDKTTSVDYNQLVKDNKKDLVKIISTFAAERPADFGTIISDFYRRAGIPQTPQAFAEQLYLNSYMIDVLVPIARKVAPEFDIEIFGQ